MARRLRGISLGFLFVAINILLVAGLVLATSSRNLSDLVADDESPTPSPSPTLTLTPRPTPTSTPTVEIDPAADVKERYADGGALNVVVLGDQTGTDTNDWVQAWTRGIASERPVTYLAPTAADPTRYGSPTSVGAIEPDPKRGVITIRNASIVGATPGYVTPRMALLVPTDTDLVLLNFGRSNTPADIGGELAELETALIDHVPKASIRLVVQPPRQDGEPTLDEVVRSSGALNEIPLVDVAAEFTSQGLLTDTVSARDPLSVNIRGGQIWAAIVQKAVFGSWSGNPFSGGELVAPTQTPTIAPQQVPTVTATPRPIVPPRTATPPRGTSPASPSPRPTTTSPTPRPTTSQPAPTTTTTTEPAPPTTTEPEPPITTEPPPPDPEPDPGEDPLPPIDPEG